MDLCRQRGALLLLVHHTDSEREWAYDRTSSIGQLDKALDEAKARGWTVVDMKQNRGAMETPSNPRWCRRSSGTPHLRSWREGKRGDAWASSARLIN